MEVLERITFIILNLLNVYVSVRYLRVFLSQDEHMKRIGYILCLFYWVQNSLCRLLIISDSINLISNSIGILLIALLAYGGSVWKRIMATLLVIAVRMAAEDLVWVYLHDRWTDSVGRIALSAVILLEVLLLEIFVEKFFSFKNRKNPTDFISQSHYLLIILLSAGSIGLVFILVETGIGESIYTMVGLTMIVLLNFLILYLYDRILASYGERWEKLLLQQRLSMYENQMEILKNSREKVYSLRHDLKNHTHFLAELIKSGQNQEALSYMETMTQSMTVEEQIVTTGNEQIDAILNYHLERAKTQGASLSVKVSIPQTPFCSMFDLNILLSNLLENAVEAVSDCDTKYLKFSMELEKGVLYVHVENSYSGMRNQKNGVYQTSKSGREPHGIGLKNVRDIVGKYQGVLKFNDEDGIFKVDAILYTGQN